MSEYFSKLFRATSPKPISRQPQKIGKQLPKDFAQQILDNDIILVLSEYTNNDALRNLINLYMLGVEHFKEIQDQSYQYFQIKLNKIILNPVVTSQNTQQTITTQQNLYESPVVKKKSPQPPKIDVNINNSNSDIQEIQYAKTAILPRDIKANTFHFNEETITETINEKITKHHNSNQISCVDFDQEKLKYDTQNRVQSQQDERKENMTLDLKQQLFLFDENKEANDLIDQYRNDQQKIDKIKNDQLTKQTTAFLMKLSQRNNKKKMNTQIVNRYNSQPNFQNKNNTNSEQRPIEPLVIYEDKNESSSKITSSEKNTQKFQFDDLQDN